MDLKPYSREATKLKRFILRKNGFLLTSHLMISVICFYSIINAVYLLYTANDAYYQNEFIKHGVRYSPLLLSLWVAAAAIVCFNIYTALGIIEFHATNTIQRRKWINILHTIASYLLFAVVFPLSLVVLLVFWGFYFYNYQTIYPEAVRPVLTQTLNHLCHTLPPIGAVFYIASSNKITPPKSSTLLVGVFVLIFYGICIIIIKIWHGKWVYLAFEALSPLQMVFFLGSCLLGSIFFHHLGHAVNEFFISLSQKAERREINRQLKTYRPRTKKKLIYGH